MTIYPHLKDFNTPEGHWLDRNDFRPLIQDIYAKYKVKTILEIGFNIGYSASMWLEFDPDQKSHITSVDIGIHKDTVPASEAVKSLYPDRFSFILEDSKKVYNKVKNQLFDMIFIDGDHSGPGIYNDLQLALRLGIPLILVDDWEENTSPSYPIKGVCDDLVKENKLQLLRAYNLETLDTKVALYKNATIHSEKNTLKRQLSFLSPKSW